MRTMYLVRAVVLQLPDLTVRVLGLVHVKVPLEFKSVFLRKTISLQYFLFYFYLTRQGNTFPSSCRLSSSSSPPWCQSWLAWQNLRASCLHSLKNKLKN